MKISEKIVLGEMFLIAGLSIMSVSAAAMKINDRLFTVEKKLKDLENYVYIIK